MSDKFGISESIDNSDSLVEFTNELISEANKKGETDEYGLTTEALLEQKNANWKIAQDIFLNICDFDTNKTERDALIIQLTGEMGAGKTEIKQMLIKLLEIADRENRQILNFKLQDGRIDSDGKPMDSRSPKGIDKIHEPKEILPGDFNSLVQQIKIAELKRGDIIMVSELQFILGFEENVIIENALELSEYLNDIGVHLIADCLESFSKGNPVTGSLFIGEIADQVYRPRAINVIDKNTPPDHNFRFIEVNENGEPIHQTDLQEEFRTKLDEQEIIEMISTIKSGNGDRRLGFLKYERNGKMIYRIPMSMDDPDYVPGGRERYATLAFNDVIKIYSSPGRTVDLAILEGNRSSKPALVTRLKGIWKQVRSA
ncbi:MAG: hypothetical protein Q9M91_02395 [Candidatus Dojkabacteria bacterium]|nr:hypothetical protein [Candidatus Dojkabacteria bacterium]MDQ7020675.1 hypothetical protein [Candidatus Dojkabacteria bacterium]